MGRYIDADMLIDSFMSKLDDEETLFNRVSRRFMRLLKSSPSIDIVRCKECKHWHKWSDGEMFCGHFDGGIGSDADDYCSYGERREP